MWSSKCSPGFLFFCRNTHDWWWYRCRVRIPVLVPNWGLGSEARWSLTTGRWSRSRGHSACSQRFLHMLSISQSTWIPILKPYTPAGQCFPKCVVYIVPYCMSSNLFLLSIQRDHIVSWEMRLSWPRQCGEHLDPAHRKLLTKLLHSLPSLAVLEAMCSRWCGYWREEVPGAHIAPWHEC